MKNQNNKSHLINKNILVICKERESWVFHNLLKDLRLSNNKLAAFFFMPHESLRGDEDYLNFKKLNQDIKIYDVLNSSKKYINAVNNRELNISKDYFRDNIENLNFYKSFGSHLFSSQLLLPFIHDRKYYNSVSWDSLLYFIQNYIKDLYFVISDFKPDIILDIDCAEYGRSFLLEIAKKKNIPYLTLIDGRFGGFQMASSNLNLNYDDYFLSEYKENLKNINSQSVDLFESNKWLNDFNKTELSLSASFNSLYNKKKFSYLKDTRLLISQFHAFTKYFFNSNYLKYNKKKYAPITNTSFKKMLTIFIEYFRKIYLNNRNIFDNEQDIGSNYIFVPLHIVPESSTLTLSPFYIDEMEILKNICQSVAYNQKIVVKEHWAMGGERQMNFYKKLKKIPNLILLSPYSSLSSKELIKNADGVITISGTVGLESVAMGVNCATFAHVPFNIIEGVTYISNIRKLPEIIKGWKFSKPNKNSILAYIKTILDNSYPINHEFFLDSGKMSNENVSLNIRNLKNIYNNYLNKIS